MQSELWQLFISRGGRIGEMHITNYKSKTELPIFHRPSFRKELETGIAKPGLSINEYTGTKEYIAVYLPNDVIIDVDIKNDAKPPESVLQTIYALKDRFYWLPSMTKTKYGCHIIVPKANFANLPEKGNPKLDSLCFGANFVEVLIDKPTIYKAGLASKYRRNTLKMSPQQLDLLSFSPEASVNAKADINRSVESRQTFPLSSQDKPHAELRGLLSHMAPNRCDEYEHWWKITQICKSCGDKEAWIDWSRQSKENFNAHINEVIWDRVERSYFGIATLKYYAREDNPAGYSNYADSKYRLEKDGYSIIEGSEAIYQGKEIRTKDQLMSAGERHSYWDGKAMRNIRTAWLRDPTHKCYTKVVNVPYNPKESDPTPEEHLNLARPMGFKYVEGTTADDLLPLMQVLEQNVSDPTKITYNLDHMCHMIQFPRERVMTALCDFGNGKGTGKNTKIELLKGVLGDHNVLEVPNIEHIFSKHNESLAHRHLVVLNELSSNVGHKHSHQFRDLVTARQLTLEPKGSKQYTLDNYARVHFNSNDFNPLQPDRRYVINRTIPHTIESAEAMKSSFTNIYDNILGNQEAMNRLGSAMLEHKITSDLNNRPETAADLDRAASLQRPAHTVFQKICEGDYMVGDNKANDPFSDSLTSPFGIDTSCTDADGNRQIRITTALFKDKVRLECINRGMLSKEYTTERDNWIVQYPGFVRKCRVQIQGKRCWGLIIKPALLSVLKKNLQYCERDMLDDFYR